MAPYPTEATRLDKEPRRALHANGYAKRPTQAGRYGRAGLARASSLELCDTADSGRSPSGVSTEGGAIHIRVTPGTVRADKMDEATAVIDELFAAYRNSGGFRQGYLGADRQSGEGMVVTLWDSEEQALAANQQVGGILAKLAPLTVLGQTPVPARAFEVLTQG